ncbi:MAG: hypothetical protein HYZ27_02260 [Deltaproteobacteria bacterium]|nr:hypothetical protein [Deltaproteobacteria bacterium]
MLLWGCGDEKPAPAATPGADAVQDTGDQDIFVQNDTGFQVDVDIVDSGTDTIQVLDISQDVTAEVDAGPVCPGAAGCPCSATTDCSSGFCLDTPSGQQCAQTCPTGECPADYKCSTVPLTGGDSANICVPALAKLCNPCTSNTQCQGPGNGGARCIDTGNGGAFCGVQCNAQADCPGGYECKNAKDIAGSTSKQCVVTSGICPCTKAAILNEAYTICYKDTGSAKCAGKRVCLADGKPGAPIGGGLSACLADDPEAESCDGKDNDCDGQVDELSCDDNNPCTDDTCAPGAGCSHINNSGFCDADGNVCTKDDACSNGKCLTGQPIKCDDNNPCTTDSCDAKTGCKNEAAEGLGCNFDDNPCTVGDSCKTGKCEAGPKKACASDDQCVEGKCDIIKDGVCVYKNKASPCDDGDLCTESDLCNAGDGTCAGKLVNCDDTNPCTADQCDKKAGCLHNNSAGPCDDGNNCTLNDSCSNGKCDGKTVDAANYCNDNNVCTNDSCNPALGCVNKIALGVQCEDGNACSVGDKCDDKGQCVPGTNTCACDTDAQCEAKDDGNLCNGTLFCDKATALSQCKLKPGSSITCNTSNDNACSKTVCEPATGKCVAQVQPTGLPCDADKSVCTTDDGCKSGQCAPGKLLACDDKNPCTLDTCDDAAGCQYTPTSGACDVDGDACTQNDACKSGKCEAGVKKVCEDGEVCTADSCNKVTAQCEFKPLSQGCTDGSECTIGDACGTDPKTGKHTCLAGNGPNCDDGNPCTLDTCEIAAGCKNIKDATIKVPCYSGAPKTDGVGICKAGTQACDANGVLGPCSGEVVPEKTDACDGKDNDCNGVADPGCAPKEFTARFATADIRGKSADGKSIGVIAGASNVSGLSSGNPWNIKFGFVAWLKGLLSL